MTSLRGHILVVDDHRTTRLKLCLGLRQQGHSVGEAENGREALEKLRTGAYDLVLLDILMPEMNGYQVLEAMKADAGLREVPVIVISAQDELDSVVRGIELGADDYLPKTFEPILLRARIGACLEKKRLRDIEQRYVEEIRRERERSDQLLLNILPESAADRLKRGETVADSFEQVSILFADIAGFTQFSNGRSPADVVEVLNLVFSEFDELSERFGLEKIKTIGDAYMVVAGLPESRPDHAAVLAQMALQMLAVTDTLRQAGYCDLAIRIGMNTGSAMAGIIGFKKFAYDVWGDAINVASRMETSGLPGKIQVSEQMYALLKEEFVLHERGLVEIRGKGEMRTYFLEGARARAYPVEE